MKRVLIISPHFPPINGADMHRVRQSLPYFKKFGWETEIMVVDPDYVNAYSTDPLLLKTIPPDVKIHKVKAWDIKKARKFGLGSLSIRSFFYFKKKGNQLLAAGKFDLVYFSTTAFHVMALGPYWLRKYGVPFILDMQDPWRNDFYLDKPKSERPPKYWMAYNIDKYLEARTVTKAAGIISVSEGYCKEFSARYKDFKIENCCTIPFAIDALDFKIMKEEVSKVDGIVLDKNKINIVYVGRGGYDMQFAAEIVFAAIKNGMDRKLKDFDRLHLWFIGTSYAPAGEGQKTFMPVAVKYGLESSVTEITDRISYFETLYMLDKAEMLLITGSTDTKYTASKVYPYIFSEKPLLAVFYKSSSVVIILKECSAGNVITFDLVDDISTHVSKCQEFLLTMIGNIGSGVSYDKEAFSKYLAINMTRRQVDFFEKVLVQHHQ